MKKGIRVEEIQKEEERQIYQRGKVATAADPVARQKALWSAGTTEEKEWEINGIV